MGPASYWRQRSYRSNRSYRSYGLILTRIAQTLAGRTVVITRALAQADDFAAELQSYGARVILCPTIEINALDSYERLDEAIDHLYGYDWLVFTSVNGVDYFFH